jgi:hypothetical protein
MKRFYSKNHQIFQNHWQKFKREELWYFKNVLMDGVKLNQKTLIN